MMLWYRYSNLLELSVLHSKSTCSFCPRCKSWSHAPASASILSMWSRTHFRTWNLTAQYSPQKFGFSRSGPKFESSIKAPHEESQPRQHRSKADSTTLRIFMSTGDVMGDIHGANLIKEIFKQAEQLGRSVEVFGLGGQRMKEAGAVLIGDNTGISSIGLLEALPLVLPSVHLQCAVRRFIDQHPPNVLVLLDYPGINIPFGQYVKQKFGCAIIYYIPPNEWLWNTSRSAKIVEITDAILAVYPDEADYYRSIGGNVKLVGHPLIDAVKSLSREEARRTLGVPVEDIVVALFPASRAQELRHVWPIMAAAAGKLFKALVPNREGPLGVHFIIPAVIFDRRHLIEKGCQDNGFAANSLIWSGDSHLAMAASDVAIAKSGSVNLELALYNVPQVVVYKIDTSTAWIARKVFGFSVKHVSLVNLIVNSQVVPEFIQEAVDIDMIVRATLDLLPNTDTCKRMRVLDGYGQLRTLLGKPGVVARAAQKILVS